MLLSYPNPRDLSATAAGHPGCGVTVHGGLGGSTDGCLRIADPDADAQIESVERTLQELSLLEIPRVLVLNKADMEHSEEWREVMEERRNAVVVTAMDKQSLRPLIKVIGSTLFGQNRSSLVPGNEDSPPSSEYYPGDSTKGPKD